MDLLSFRATLSQTEPPPELSIALRGLWLERQGDWDGAHQTVQVSEEWDCSWVHAYLHRKEGDLSNAAYWYKRARRDTSGLSLDEEWSTIASALLRG